MKRLRILVSLLAAALLSGLLGCDVALVAVLASRSKSDSSANTTPLVDGTFHVFVKQVAGGNETNELNGIVSAGGNPSGSGWAAIGSALVSGEFLLPAAGTFNAIAISTNDVVPYNIDAVQILNAAGDVVETASGITYSDHVSLPDRLLGPPDGSVASTFADSSHMSVVFTVYSLANSPVKVRVNAWGSAPTSGDIDRLQLPALGRGGIQRTGGAALKSDGTLYVMARDDFGPNRDVLLYKFPASTSGAPNPVVLESGGNSALGGNAIAITASDQVFTATTAPGLSNPSSVIHLQKLEGTGPLWTQNFGPASNALSRIEANGLALDASGNLILAGAVDFGAALGGIGNFLRKIGPDGSPLWSLPPGPPSALDLNDDYWYAVTAGGGDIFVCGDLQKNAPSGSIQAFTQQIDGSDANNGAQLWQDFNDGPNAPNTAADRGNAIARNTQGDVFVGGFYGSSGPARNGLILKYPNGNSPGGVSPLFSATSNADSEVLGLAVDPSDNSLFATGYETVTLISSRKHLFLMKFNSAGTLLWKRTFNAGFGDDRGVCVVLNPLVDPNHVYVVGESTVAVGDVDVLSMRFIK